MGDNNIKMNHLCDWQVKKNKLAERGQYLLENPHWSDCSFLVGSEFNQQTFNCHKLLLAISSPVFEAMFYGGMAEKTNPVAILDVQPGAFKAMLEYIYTDKINLQSFDQACELCYAAKKYMLPHVVKECTNHLWTDLYPKNVCRAYEFAKLFDEPKLLERCLEIIKDKTNEVIAEANFEDISLPTLEMILQQDNLKVSSELDLIDASLRWARKEVERKSLTNDGAGLREALGTAISHLRFLTLTPTQFADGPALSEILTRDESFAILINISSPGRIQLPDGMSSKTDRRCSSNPDPYSSVILEENLAQRDNRKFFCQRLLVEEEIHCYNSCNMDCSVTFSVDRNICVLGIQLPTQKHASMQTVTRDILIGSTLHPIRPMCSAFPSTYNELIYAHLLDSENSRLTYTHFTGRVRYDSIIDINFNRPVFIQKNKEYRIWVVLNKVGTYPGGNCSDQLITAGINFNFRSGECNNSERDSIIRSIIFNKA